MTGNKTERWDETCTCRPPGSLTKPTVKVDPARISSSLTESVTVTETYDKKEEDSGGRRAAQVLFIV